MELIDLRDVWIHYILGYCDKYTKYVLRHTNKFLNESIDIESIKYIYICVLVSSPNRYQVPLYKNGNFCGTMTIPSHVNEECTFCPSIYFSGKYADKLKKGRRFVINYNFNLSRDWFAICGHSETE